MLDCHCTRNNGHVSPTFDHMYFSLHTSSCTGSCWSKAWFSIVDHRLHFLQVFRNWSELACLTEKKKYIFFCFQKHKFADVWTSPIFGFHWRESPCGFFQGAGDFPRVCFTTKNPLKENFSRIKLPRDGKFQRRFMPGEIFPSLKFHVRSFPSHVKHISHTQTHKSSNQPQTYFN